MLAGVVATDSSVDSLDLSRQLIAHIPESHRASVTPLIEKATCACYWVSRSGPPPTLWQLETRDSRAVIVAGHVAIPTIRAREVQAQLAEEPERGLLELPGMWNALIFDPRSGRTRLATDRLGVAWLFVARHSGALAFAGHFAAVAKTLPREPRLNRSVALAILEMGYSPSDQTCIQGIEVLPAGCIVEPDERANRTVAKRPLSYGDVHAHLPEAEKLALLDAAHASALLDWCPQADVQHLVSLSGGYDSALLLGLALYHRRLVKCVTYGNPRTPDIRGAIGTARAGGASQELFPIPDPQWEELCATVARSGVTGGQSYFHGWAERWLSWVHHRGDRVIIGYLGDALSGKHLVGSASSAAQWALNWESWSLDGGWERSPLLHPQPRRELRPACQAQFQALLRGVETAFPHQTALHLDLYGRQRRLIAVQPNLIADHLMPALIFYHPSIFDLWCNLDIDDLRRQSLYLKYASSKFPGLFLGRLNPSMVQRLRGASANAVLSRWPALKRRVRPPVDDRLATMRRFRDNIITLVRHVSDQLTELLDEQALLAEIRQFPNSKVLAPVPLSRLVGILIMLRAART